MDGGNQRNLLLAIALSVAILVGFNVFFEGPQREQPVETQQSGELDTRPGVAGDVGTGEPATSRSLDAAIGAEAGAVQSREQALEAAPRVAIDTPTLRGSISLVGAKLDDLVLKRYRETVEPQSPNIVLLNPSGTADAYFAEFGWAASGGGAALPGPDTRWRADGETLTPESPVTLSWDNGQGLVFEQTFEVDRDYLFTVTQRVSNGSGATLQVAPFGLVSRSGTPETAGFYLLHEGMVGVLDETLKEVDYDDAQDEGTVTYQSTGGWLGITDKYWMATLVPDQRRAVTGRFVHSAANGRDKYQSDFLYETDSLVEGGTLETTSRLYAGAKRATLLDDYAERYGIEKFDLAVDFGWFYFLTKPIFLALHWLYGVIGNFGVAILILTVGIKLLFFPLANKSYKSMARMRKLQPEIMKLRERFSDDKQRLNQEVMALYKREGANPISGCLPVIIQIPVFFALYKVLFVTIEM
ncbi:MAG: membrane protein insertase YidC, partial [Tistlia sp.]|uniref:membrane protein insertase YidC n=1 Tax=Tistlia sp. TaxID=3057121 RepID=UPI0034A2F48B